MKSEEIKQLDGEYILGTYPRFDLCLVEGKGCRAKDAEGNSYLDFTAGIGVNSLGWCDDEWVSAVGAQAAKLQHTSNLFYTESGALLAEKLCQRTGMSRVFFANSGTEANEGAIKAARKYSKLKYGEGRSTILSLQNSFHGRTLAALAATGQEALQKDFEPLMPGFRYLPANDTALLETALTADICAVMLEPIQGEGGVLPLSQSYLQAVQTMCGERDVLVIADEIQTGVGRTGYFLASGNGGLKPDIVTLAKGLGGGLPIGAILFCEKCIDSLGKGGHGSTFGMNPVVCAGANVVMDRLSDTFLDEVKSKGKLLEEGLKKLPCVDKVEGAGLMWGVQFAPPVAAAQVREKAQEAGLLCLLAKDRLRLLPPLVIGEGEINEGLATLQSVLHSLA